ncbi:MAG: cytochrome c-type biogenesis protein, partial [Actinomycetota bacterium]
ARRRRHEPGFGTGPTTRGGVAMRTPAALLLIIVLALPACALAMTGPEDVANDVAGQVMSPYCPGVTLHDCTSAEANELRDRIVGWAEDGMSERQIMVRLEDQFGPSIRATPSSEGTGVVAWILPTLVTLIGAAGAVWALRRRRARATAPEIAPRQVVALSAEERRRIDGELNRFRSRQ